MPNLRKTISQAHKPQNSLNLFQHKTQNIFLRHTALKSHLSSTTQITQTPFLKHISKKKNHPISTTQVTKHQPYSHKTHINTYTCTKLTHTHTVMCTHAHTQKQFNFNNTFCKKHHSSQSHRPQNYSISQIQVTETPFSSTQTSKNHPFTLNQAT